MIDTKELRVENLVLSPTGWIGRVYNVSPQFVTIVDDNLEPYAFGSDLINPIPITPEWLERLGWHLSHHGYWEYFTDIIGMTWDKETGFDAHFADTDIATGLPHIKYIHQLQNLYFALTGQELTIKQ